MNPIRHLARLLLFLSTLTHAADLPRVAVIPDSPEPSVAAFADFLSVSLASASDQYTLVERAELSRLESEYEIQKLAADQHPAALAKLANADGLIIVGADKGDPNLTKLTLRLTSTNNGLVLRSLILGDKESDYPEAAGLAAGVLRFPCERLSRRDAKPPIIVSLLGIRPAFETDGTLETTLNHAVALQLSAQSGMAVSERWRMNDLLFERSLTDKTSDALTTGTVLLDGSYTRKGDQLEVSLRLRKTESDPGKILILQGPATKPAYLAEQIAKLVATESGQSGKAVPWNSMEEGKQYADLGWWLFMRNMPAESIRSYETTVALGVDGRMVAGGFMLAYQNILYNDSKVGMEIYRTQVRGWDKLPKLQFKQNLINAISMSQHCIEVIDTKWGGVAQQEFSRLHMRPFLLSSALAMNMKVLQSICLRGEQLELAAEARILRALSRELVKKGEADVLSKFSFQVVQLGYMFDTPEEAAADLRSRLLPEFMLVDPSCDGARLRLELWGTFHDPQLWRLVDWSSTDNLRGREAWKKLIDDLLSSDSLIARSDGHAFAYQTSDDTKERDEILLSYCTLLENNFDELLTPRGQMSFICFKDYSASCHKREQHPAYELRMAGILTRILESGKTLESATIEMLHNTTENWCQENAKGKAIIPESVVISILHLIETYIETHKLGTFSERLKEIPGLLIHAYPRIKEQRVSMRPTIEDAVPILGYKPELPGAATSEIMMISNHMVSSGHSLLIPSLKHGILDVDLRTLSVARVMELPFLKAQFIGGFTKNETSLMINVEHRLFSNSILGDGKSWEELLIPDVKPEDRLKWHIQGIGSKFFVGSCMLDSRSGSPHRMLAGIVREGELKWEISSQRRPAVNLIDKIDPHDVRCAYQNSRGNTMVLLEGMPDMLLVELETGREIISTLTGGKVLSKGEMPLLIFYRSEIQFLAALDPTLEQPRFLFKGNWGDQFVPKNWKNMRPVYDCRRPEFLGQWISIIFYNGHLWLLKREAEQAAKFELNDPQAFRLVRMDLNGGEPIVIPLRYDVAEEIRKLEDGSKKSLERPIINYQSLTATPKGLFFAGSGLNYRFSHGEHSTWGRFFGADVPALLYITWDDINAWLAKNAPESAKPASR